MALAALSAVYLVLLWVSSSLLRGKGVLLFAAGTLALGVVLRAAARGRRGPFHTLFLLAVGAASATLAVEACLWFIPNLLQGRLANLAYGGYHLERTGIYDADPFLGSRLRPDTRRRLYWNGRWWLHETNADGYRGPRLERADAVFLGDSMIYGHGVETGEAVPARFGALTGLATANLGQQGTSLVQGLELLRRSGLALKPRLIVACSHPTDVEDALQAYPQEELERFESEPGYRPHARPIHSSGLFDLWLLRVALPLRAGRVLQGALRSDAASLELAGLPVATDARFVPPAEYVGSPFAPDAPEAAPRLRLGWRAQRRAAAEIKREADRIGARLVLLDLGYPAAFSRAVESLAASLGAPYSAAGRVVLARAQSGEELYLRADGHWSPAGCDAVARALASDLGLLPAAPSAPAAPSRQ